jgi:hypothetical protein
VGKGGFYITTIHNIKQYVYYGIKVCIVDLPLDNPEFEMISLSEYNPGTFRTNMIILTDIEYHFDNLDNIKYLISQDDEISLFLRDVVVDAECKQYLNMLSLLNVDI